MRFGILVAVVTLVGMGAINVAHAADGAAVYKTNCANCHGATAKADTNVARVMKVPALAGSAKVAAMAEADLAKSIKENPKHTTLKSVSADDLAAVAKYVKGLAAGK